MNGRNYLFQISIKAAAAEMPTQMKESLSRTQVYFTVPPKDVIFLLLFILLSPDNASCYYSEFILLSPVKDLYLRKISPFPASFLQHLTDI
jgi:hypothetical protein